MHVWLEVNFHIRGHHFLTCFFPSISWSGQITNGTICALLLEEEWRISLWANFSIVFKYLWLEELDLFWSIQIHIKCRWSQCKTEVNESKIQSYPKNQDFLKTFVSFSWQTSNCFKFQHIAHQCDDTMKMNLLVDIKYKLILFAHHI